MKNNHAKPLLLAIAITLPYSASANQANEQYEPSPQYQQPAEPSTPERGNTPAQEQAKIRNNSDAGCRSVYADYAAAYMEWVESPPSLMNECGMGRLINFQLLKGFDPFGAIIEAIKGGICGFVKNEINDPLVAKINEKISKHNRWVNDTNDQYSSWIDEESRRLQESIYDPTSGFNPVGPVGEFEYDTPRPPADNQPEPPPVVEVPIDVVEPEPDDIINDDDGGTSTVGDNDDGSQVIIGSDPVPITGDGEDDSFEDIYNLYE